MKAVIPDVTQKLDPGSEGLNKAAEMRLFCIKGGLWLKGKGRVTRAPVIVVVKKEDGIIMQNCRNENCRHLALFGFELLLSSSRCK